MKNVIIFLLIFLISGCTNLRHKSFRTTFHVKGGRITLTDPASNQFMPTLIFGQSTNSIMTIPYGCKVKAHIISYQFWSSKKSYEEIVEIDATKIKPEVVKAEFKQFEKKNKGRTKK